MVNQPYSEGMSGDYTISDSSNNYIAIYEYNCYNQLVEVDTDGVISSYAYAPDGLRHSKTVGGNTTTFVYDNANVVEEITADGTNKYYRGIEIIKNDDNLYYIYNGQGDVAFLIDADGTSVADYVFDAYGNQSEENTIYNPFGYRGEYTDTENGLIYLRARMYDPQTGRFINEDPIRDGSNWYVYCENNPIMFVDPSGTVYVIAWSYGTTDLENFEQHYNNVNDGKLKVDGDTVDWTKKTWAVFTQKSSFARAAYTLKEELINKGIASTEIDIQRIDSKTDLEKTWEMWKGYDLIDGLDFFSHGYQQGPEVFRGSGSFWRNCAKLNWKDSGAYAKFYGCNTANGEFSQNFADTQGVVTYGQVDFSSFSYKESTYERVITYNTSLNVYMGVYKKFFGFKTTLIPMKEFTPSNN